MKEEELFSHPLPLSLSPPLSLNPQILVDRPDMILPTFPPKSMPGTIGNL
jgi:hypothetical protein